MSSSRFLAGLFAFHCSLLSPVVAAFDFADVAAKAQALAAASYQAPDNNLPAALQNLTYDQYRNIRYKPEFSLWREEELPFEVQFFHPGFLYREPVTLHLVDDDGDEVSPLPFSAKAFDYGQAQLDLEDVESLGYAGFRVHYPINHPRYKDEIAVFLGASYFRALGGNQLYGLSARGLAVDTAEMSGEEFPAFREFWLQQPEDEDSKHLIIYALLDSPSVTGSYRFDLTPGRETTLAVRSRLFLRKAVKKIGIAPLTSMYQFGENQPAAAPDYRPEVHDSDGLLIHNGNGEWLWRPLVNPTRLLTTSFGVQKLAGFGLMQRDRQFDHYQDLEANYDRRPSAWVSPTNDWGAGRVELVQIPTPDETNDNIVAYWVPDVMPEVRQPLDINYQLRWQHDQLTTPPLAQVVQTRKGHGWRKTVDDSQRFIIDFAGGAKGLLKLDKLEAGVWLGDNGELLEQQLFRNTHTGGWRLSLRYRRKNEQPLEMRAMLHRNGKAVSETWSYVLP